MRRSEVQRLKVLADEACERWHSISEGRKYSLGDIEVDVWLGNYDGGDPTALYIRTARVDLSKLGPESLRKLAKLREVVDAWNRNELDSLPERL